MSSPKSSKQRQMIAYLQRSLQMNPLFQSDEIIAARSAALGLNTQRGTTKIPATRPDFGDRTKLLHRLDQIRSEIWEKFPDQLLAKLNSLHLDGFPELKRTAQRLQTIVANRSLLATLVNHRHFDEDFLSCFKQVLSLPPREVSVLRERVLASFRNSKMRKRGLKMLALIKSQVPALYELERDWLDSLKRQKTHRDEIVRQGGNYSSGSESSNIPWWIIWIIVVVGLNLLRAAFSE